MTVDAYYQPIFILRFWRRLCSRRFTISVDADGVPRWFPCPRSSRDPMMHGVPKPTDNTAQDSGNSASFGMRLLGVNGDFYFGSKLGGRVLSLFHVQGSTVRGVAIWGDTTEDSGELESNGTLP